MNSRRRNVLALAIVIALTTACIHKTGGTVTPWERVMTYNASIAQSNNTVEQGCEAVVSSGLASATQIAPVISASGRIAAIHQQITAVLALGPTHANLASVQSLVDQIKASIQAIPPESLGIKNPRSQQTFQADVNSIGTLADALMSSLQAAGVK